MSSSTHGSSAKAIFYAFSANLGIAIAKSVAALFYLIGKYAGRGDSFLR
jgi:hypothetical protein